MSDHASTPPAQDLALIPIGRVVAMLGETHPEISASSLRFLEREGLIAPQRTGGGHRLYSNADIERIVQIKQWQAQRLSIDDIRERLRQLDTLPDPENLSRQFVEQALAGDTAAATATILGADELGMPLDRLFGEVLGPALVEVGDRWHQGTVLVAQEKTVSELARDLIAELSIRRADPQPRGPVIVAACVAGERHELGLRMLSGLLRSEGYRLRYLGADVASSFLADAVRLYQPAAVLLSVRFASSDDAISEAISAVRHAMPDDPPKIVVGGVLESRVRQHIGSLNATFIAGDRLSDAMAALRTIVFSGTNGLRG